jgi:hypothetical protein
MLQQLGLESPIRDDIVEQGDSLFFRSMDVLINKHNSSLCLVCLWECVCVM